MIKAIVIDDEPPAQKVLQGYCKAYETIDLVGCFSQSTEALDYLVNNSIDLVFLDIHMPGSNGLNVAKKINKDTIIVFTTAHEEHALEGYNLNAVDYLLKPISYDRFCQAMDKVQKLTQLPASIPKPDYITVRADYSLIRIVVSDIAYLEAMDDYVKFYLESSTKPIVVRSTMKSTINILPPTFLRIHRSFIVNKDKISGARKGVVLIKNKILPIGKKFNEEVSTFLDSLRRSD